MSSMSPIGVFSFPNFFKPRPASPGADPRYSVVIIWDKEAQKTEEYKVLRQNILDVAVEKFGDKAPEMLKTGQLRSPIRPCKDKAQYSGYDVEGGMFASFWTKQPPGVVNAKLTDIIDQNEAYAGCLGRVTYTAFAYDTGGNKGVSLLMNNAQVTDATTPRLDGRAKASAEFDQVAAPASAELDDELPF